VLVDGLLIEPIHPAQALQFTDLRRSCLSVRRTHPDEDTVFGASLAR
jgi:hypothetical protein